jgi:hypothetical protein
MSLLDALGSIGHNVARMVDSAIPDAGDLIQRGAQMMGLSEPYGQVAAAIFNVATGNLGSAALNAAELLTGHGIDAVTHDAGAPPASPGSQVLDPGPPPPTSGPPATSAGDGAVGAAATVSSHPATATDPAASAAFLSLPDIDLMEKIQRNEIPREVLDDPQQMLLLQQRIHQVNELFTLLSTVMRAVHEMRMGMINNTRA